MNEAALQDALRDAADGLPPDPCDVYANVIRHARARRTRHRVVMTVATLGTAVAVIMAGAALRGSDDGQVVVSGGEPTAPPVPASAFVPPVARDGNRLIVTLRFLSGGSVEVTLPGSLDPATITGFGAGGAVGWRGQPSLARDVVVERGRVADVYRNDELLQTYRGADGEPVRLYHASANNLNYLAFQIGAWVVSVWDYPPGDARGAPMTNAQREVWATRLRGRQTADGFLVLDPVDPLTPERTTDGPDVSLRLGTGRIDVLLRACQSAELHGPRDQRGFVVHDFGESGMWACDPSVPLIVHVYGAAAWQTRIVRDFGLRKLTGPLPLRG